MTLTKAELADLLFEKVGLNKREAKEFVEAFFEVVRHSLEHGAQVKLSGFGIDLADIAQRSKIGISHLRAIEDERWELMPATVYLRGFVVEYARTLKLDVSRVTRSFLDRYHRARPAREA